ncbi:MULTISPECIES: c-type cytochrome [Massilia]|jgi:cytochrome c553|uniref:C-type cytochrome n=2 Tax=Massilia TaxID=149698 RepID=A0A7X3FWD8_9BURK|nr:MULTISPECIES: c-type cytochrome [Telluria group]KQY13497.1 cytochrome C [Massilia sp. Root133]KQZ47622.1 cytochrome C [Massilia sp. Root1485]MDN4044354.1 c-type cytochrome [Massilia sp. YIM B02787]MVW58619.1 c-type cytochrome [Telluria cellulosilytica]
MNRVFQPAACAAIVKSLLASFLIVGSALAADAAHAPPAAAKADPAKGGSLYDTGDNARGLPACASCHGAGGNSTINTNPKLAGQIDNYLHKQLVDFTTPARNQPVMTTYAKMLSEDEKKNIAAYLATQQPKQGAARNKDTLELGRKIYRGGIADRGVAACASCHGATGSGIPAQYPRVAGQHQDYTVAQLQAFKAGGRSNSPQMAALAKRLSDDEMKAVADYIAGLK